MSMSQVEKGKQKRYERLWKKLQGPQSLDRFVGGITSELQGVIHRLSLLRGYEQSISDESKERLTERLTELRNQIDSVLKEVSQNGAVTTISATDAELRAIGVFGAAPKNQTEAGNQ